MPPEPMNREVLFQELTKIFQMVFDDERLQLFEAMSSKDVKRWDSLNHINLIVAIEKKFQVKFRTVEVVHLANVGELADLILKKRAS